MGVATLVERTSGAKFEASSSREYYPVSFSLRIASSCSNSRRAEGSSIQAIGAKRSSSTRVIHGSKTNRRRELRSYVVAFDDGERRPTKLNGNEPRQYDHDSRREIIEFRAEFNWDPGVFNAANSLWRRAQAIEGTLNEIFNRLSELPLLQTSRKARKFPPRGRRVAARRTFTILEPAPREQRVDCLRRPSAQSEEC